MITDVEAGKYRNMPRIALGDFNDIKYACEKEGGAYRSESSFYHFRRMLSNCGFHDVKTFGGRFTWIGQRYTNTVRTRIDRVVATSDWLDFYPNAYVQVLPW